MDYYKETLANLIKHSPDAKVFVLLHKIDKLNDMPVDNDAFYAEKEAMVIRASQSLKVKCFGTSIWDETLYLAWSSMVNSLIPNMKGIQRLLKNFGQATEVDEVVLFEAATFLVVANETLKPNKDPHRHEKISNIIKQFKLCCVDSQTQFSGMEIRNSNFCAYIDGFTSNTYIMVVTSKKTISAAVVNNNIYAASQQFEKYGYLTS